LVHQGLEVLLLLLFGKLVDNLCCLVCLKTGETLPNFFIKSWNIIIIY
jgi:hypothetical protein